MRLEGGFKRGGRTRVAECLRQLVVPDRWASIRKSSFTKCFCVYTRADKALYPSTMGCCVSLHLLGICYLDPNRTQSVVLVVMNRILIALSFRLISFISEFVAPAPDSCVKLWFQLGQRRRIQPKQLLI